MSSARDHLDPKDEEIQIRNVNSTAMKSKLPDINSIAEQTTASHTHFSQLGPEVRNSYMIMEPPPIAKVAKKKVQSKMRLGDRVASKGIE